MFPAVTTAPEPPALRSQPNRRRDTTVSVTPEELFTVRAGDLPRVTELEMADVGAAINPASSMAD